MRRRKDQPHRLNPRLSIMIGGKRLSLARDDSQVLAVAASVGEKLQCVRDLGEVVRRLVQHLAAIPDVVLDIETFGSDELRWRVRGVP